MGDAAALETVARAAIGAPPRENTPIDWYGADPAAWTHSPDRGASMALWRLDSDEATGFPTVPSVDPHMICVHLSGSMTWSAKLGDRSYRAPCNANTFCIAARRPAHLGFGIQALIGFP